jgi:hypothetical protein
MIFHFNLILQLMHITSKHFPKSNIFMIFSLIGTFFRYQRQSIIHIIFNQMNKSGFLIIRPIMRIKVGFKLLEY